MIDQNSPNVSDAILYMLSGSRPIILVVCIIAIAVAVVLWSVRSARVPSGWALLLECREGNLYRDVLRVLEVNEIGHKLHINTFAETEKMLFMSKRRLRRRMRLLIQGSPDAFDVLRIIVPKERLPEALILLEDVKRRNVGY